MRYEDAIRLKRNTVVNTSPMARFAAWLETRPANGWYDFGEPHHCALAQFRQANGHRGHDRYVVVLPGDGFFEIVEPRPWTFGAALERARALSSTYRETP